MRPGASADLGPDKPVPAGCSLDLAAAGLGRSGLGGFITSPTVRFGALAAAVWGGDTRARSSGPGESGEGLAGRGTARLDTLGVFFALGCWLLLLLGLLLALLLGVLSPLGCGLPGLGAAAEATSAAVGLPVGGLRRSTALPVLPRLAEMEPPPLLTSTCLEAPLPRPGGGGLPAAPVAPFTLILPPLPPILALRIASTAGVDADGAASEPSRPLDVPRGRPRL